MLEKNVECENHPDKNAIRLCDDCGVPFCADCLRKDSQGFYYCKYCNPVFFEKTTASEYEIPDDERLLHLKKLKNFKTKYEIEHYLLWKERKMSSPLNVTIWGMLGILGIFIFNIFIGLLLVVAYYKVGNGVKGGVIAFGTMLLLSGITSYTFLFGILAICIQIWALIDTRNMALEFQKIFQEENLKHQ